MIVKVLQGLLRPGWLIGLSYRFTFFIDYLTYLN